MFPYPEVLEITVPMTIRFTKSHLQSIQVPDGKSYLIVRDDHVKGLHLKIGRTSPAFFMEKSIAGRKGNAITVKIGGLATLAAW